METDYQRYRREQEAAVSNQTGTTAGDVLFTILPNVCSILVALTLITLCGPHLNQQSRLLLEYCVIIIPCVLCCTVLSDNAIAVSQVFLIVAAANILSILAWKPKGFFKSGSARRLPFLTNFRALTNIMTVVCILAVDFRCFPRKFVKTEDYGYSLMDTGVGLFIIANALVAPECRIVGAAPKKPLYDQFLYIAQGTVPLLMLGLARFVAVEILGYQRHITEYGVHWNFFLTLACVKLFTAILSRTLTSRYSLLTGLWILAMHEYALSTKGLKEWVLSAEPRKDLLSANREGWVSLPGYMGLYFVGISLGRLIHNTYKNVDNVQLTLDIKFSSYEFHIGYTRSMLLTLKLYALASIAFVATYYCEQFFRVSRRLVNTGYCAWILTLSTLVLTFLLLIDVIMECIASCIMDKNRRKVSKHLRRDDLNAKEHVVGTVKTLEIFEAVNDNGLIFFLFANILTGSINVSIKTLHVDDACATAVILTYMVVNITFAMLRLNINHMLGLRKYD